MSKLQGEAWWNGEAFWLAVANQEYQSLDLTWLSHYPRFTEVCTHLTVAWELSFCALIWPRSTRYLMLLVGVGLHLGIGLFLGMWTFGSIMIFAYLSFVPPGVWSNLRGFIRGRLDLKQFKEVGLVHGGIIPTELDPKQGITEDLSLRQEVAVTCDSEEENSQQYSFPILQRDGIEFMQNIILVSENREVLRRMVPVFSKSDRQIVAVASFQEAEILSHLIPNAIVLTGSNVSDTSEPCLFLKVVQGIELTKGSNQPQANVGRVSKDPEERMLTDESPQCQEDPLGDDENSEEWNSNVDVVKLPR